MRIINKFWICSFVFISVLLLLLLLIQCKKDKENNDNNITPPPSSNITDIDGNIYHAVTIDNKVWMLENLKTTKYNDGTSIPNVTDNSEWDNLTTGAYCDYSNSPSNSTVYGRLYNWYAVSDTKKMCPVGWHVATDTEWTSLTSYLGGESIAGGKLKEADTTHWNTPNTGATNESGFKALPGGERRPNGEFLYLRQYGNWWTVTESNASSSWCRYMDFDDANVDRDDYDKQYAFSVRCIKD